MLALKTQGQSLFQAQDDVCLRCALLLYDESLLCCTVVKTCSELLSCSSRSLRFPAAVSHLAVLPSLPFGVQDAWGGQCGAPA